MGPEPCEWSPSSLPLSPASADRAFSLRPPPARSRSGGEDRKRAGESTGRSRPRARGGGRSRRRTSAGPAHRPSWSAGSLRRILGKYPVRVAAAGGVRWCRLLPWVGDCARSGGCWRPLQKALQEVLEKVYYYKRARMHTIHLRLYY